MVDLTVSLGVKLDDQTATKLALGLRKTREERELFALKAALSELSDLCLGLWCLLKFLELFNCLLIAGLARAADLEAHVVSFRELRG